MAESKVAQFVAGELANPAGNGARHSQMRSLMLSLLEIALSPEAIFMQFRQMYDEDVPDSEIKDIIKWGLTRVGKNRTTKKDREPRTLTKEQAIAKATAWLSGFNADEADLWDASLVHPGDCDEPGQDSILVLQHLYRAHELVCINTRYRVSPKNDGEQKVTIIGPGETRTAAQWVEYIKVHGTPEDRAGAWIRLNPVRIVHGSGAGGTHCDADVANWRYLLVETDLLPPELALSVYGKMALPVAAIIDSAGRGPHCWVTLNAQSPEEYAQKAGHILKRLAGIGFDPGNANPSRYGRLAGARRVIGARGDSDGFQRLLYLAPYLKPKGIFS
jgi:hypothetical protein